MSEIENSHRAPHSDVVIIPTYNEKENIEAIIDAVLALDGDFDVLVVDDNSPDGTAALVRGVMERRPGRVDLLCRQGKQGLGTAYLAGFDRVLERGYERIYEMDADFIGVGFNPADLPRLRAALEADADVAVGSRYCNGVNVVNWPMGRVLMSYFASKYVRLVTGIPVHDTTAGFVGYRADVLRTIGLDTIRSRSR